MRSASIICWSRLSPIRFWSADIHPDCVLKPRLLELILPRCWVAHWAAIFYLGPRSTPWRWLGSLTRPSWTKSKSLMLASARLFSFSPPPWPLSGRRRQWGGARLAWRSRTVFSDGQTGRLPSSCCRRRCPLGRSRSTASLLSPTYWF